MNLKLSFALMCVLFAAGAYCWIHRYHPYPYYPPARKQIYGTVDGFDRLGYQHERRFGIPLMTRDLDIIFPSVRKCQIKTNPFLNILNLRF